MIKAFSNHKKAQKLINTFPLHLDAANEKHILVFRRLIDRSLKYGYWNGRMAALS